MRALALGTVLCLTTSVASAAILDFEGNDSGDILNSFSVDGITGSIAAVGFGKGSDIAMVFDTDDFTGGDDDLEAPFYAELTGSNPPKGTPVDGTAELSPGNVLIISEDGDADDPDDNGQGGTITFTFDSLVTFMGFDVLDDVTNFTVTANTNDTTGPISLAYDNQFQSFADLNWAGVSEVVFDFGSASGAIDNIAFEATPVPVPASLPLLAAGFGIFGLMKRKRRG